MTIRRTTAFAMPAGAVGAAPATPGRLVAHIFIHKGDVSGLVAEHERLLQLPASLGPEQFIEGLLQRSSVQLREFLAYLSMHQQSRSSTIPTITDIADRYRTGIRPDPEC